jgi:DNA-binding transcriptional ArsR family regulator
MTVPLYQAKADLLRVLAHPARIRVLELLADRERSGGELLAKIAIDACGLSHQLAVLRRAGLVEQRRERAGLVYSLLVPEVCDVLVAARTLLEALPGEPDAFVTDLRLPVTPAAGASVGSVASAVARRSLAG